METLANFAARCRSILASETFASDAALSVVYAGRPGVDYGAGPGTLMAQARGGRLMLFTEGWPLDEDEDRHPIGYAHAVLYVWPSEWPSLPYLSEAIGAGRVVTLLGADPEDPSRPLLTGEPSDLFVGGFAPPPKAEDLTAQDVYVPLDVLQVLAREERALEAAMREETLADGPFPAIARDPVRPITAADRVRRTEARRAVQLAAIRVEATRNELLARLLPRDVGVALAGSSLGVEHRTALLAAHRELFHRPC